MFLGFRYGPVFIQVPLLLVDYKWSHNPLACWILPPPVAELTKFRNSVVKVARLQALASALFIYLLFIYRWLKRTNNNLQNIIKCDHIWLQIIKHIWLIHVNYQRENKNLNAGCTSYMGSNVICIYQMGN